MRVKSSLINISAGLGNQLIITALSFISRSVFISTLGIEYLGVNGLFTSLLAMLSLAEAGIGSSIIYNLYKPVAENDQEKINRLMKLYRNAYLGIALVVLLLGLTLLPFLDHFVKDTSVKDVYMIYLIFLFNTVIPYFFQYKQSFLNVSQKGYVVTSVYSVSQIVSTSLKIAVLTYTQNYILYLVMDSIITITTSMILNTIVNRMYPFLKNKPTGKLDAETKANLFKNIKAIVLQNIGAYFVLGADSLIISAFVSLAAVGLYSNYKMLIDISRTFLNQIFNNMYHSVGNLVAKESSAKVYQVYKVTMLMNFWLYSLFTIFLAIIIQPFITVWLGSKFLMEGSVLFVLMLLFYERGMRNSITTVKTTAGIFYEDRFAPLCQAAVSVTLSLVLVHYMGITGVFVGSLISALVVPYWLTPLLVYRKVFQQPLGHYFLRYGAYTAVGIGTYFAAQYMTGFIRMDGFFSIVWKSIVCLFVINAVYIAVFYKSDEFKYISRLIAALIKKLPIGSKLSRKMEGVEQ
ncbi:lipopolysaccharide biosynthesis protein [Paenibacillus mendelii]|uniref:Lipopolysaccharide biosynthesis protein n=1 Tax=Paenibacillus mendelii TaxID=206163 RepID=A0ABV6JKL4_9BACL|nr:oligosaccharide flippase family protein [Paenibacillus mendelii]MCQ6558974.1 oligosaccharide flippase family protein [Paenibacillus mendelii]